MISSSEGIVASPALLTEDFLDSARVFASILNKKLYGFSTLLETCCLTVLESSQKGGNLHRALSNKRHGGRFLYKTIARRTTIYKLRDMIM